MAYRLPEQKYTEAEYLFQTIEMAKSDEEYDVELCASSPPPSAGLVDLEQQPLFSWKVVKRRQRPHRRYTVSHGGGGPPAPPSTPTSLTANSGNGTPTPPDAAAASAVDDERLSSLLYILDYFPKYKKTLKEQQRTDAELSELFNSITITGAGNSGGTGGGGGDSSSSSSRLPPKRGISAASRVIRKHDASTKIFKIHRNPKEFFRESTTSALDGDDNSVSAPEYDDAVESEEQETRCRRLMRLKPVSRRMLQCKRHRRFVRFEHQERMDAVIDTFDAAMCFNENGRSVSDTAGIGVDATNAGTDGDIDIDGGGQGHLLSTRGRTPTPNPIINQANWY